MGSTGDCLSALAPKIKLSEERPPQASDYSNEALGNSLSALEKIRDRLKHVSPDESVPDEQFKASNVINDFLLISEHLPLPFCYLVAVEDTGQPLNPFFSCSIIPDLCAESYDQLCEDDDACATQLVWSSQQHQTLAKESYLSLRSTPKTQKLLSEHNILDEVFEFLQPRLEDWTKFPSTCHSMTVLLVQSLPHAKLHLVGRILPYLLRWLDSWMLRPKLIGCILLKSLLRDIAPTQICRFGRDELLLHALTPSINSQQPLVLTYAGDPLIILTKMIADRHKHKEAQGEVTPTDVFLQKIISSFDLESNIQKKWVKAKMIAEVVPLLPVGVLRWISRLALSLQQDLSVPSKQTPVFLRTWMLIHSLGQEHAQAVGNETEIVLPALIKLLYRWSYDEISEAVDIKDLRAVLKLQIDSNPEVAKELCEGIFDEPVNNRFDSVLRECLLEAER